MICLLTIVFASVQQKIIANVFSNLKLFFFSHNNLRRCLFTVVFASPHNRRTIANVLVTQSVFSHDMSSHFYYARLSIQICIFALIKEWSSLTFLVTRAYSRWYCLQLYLHPRINRRTIITNVFSNSSLVNLTKIRCSCKTSCSTARCACRKAAVICNLNCSNVN